MKGNFKKLVQMSTFLALSIASSVAMANFDMTINNKTDETFEVTNVIARVGNMRCKHNGKDLGKNADFDIPAKQSVTCSISHTGGIHSVNFKISHIRNPLQQVWIEADGGSNKGSLAPTPLVNPVVSINGHTIDITGSFTADD